MAKLSDSDDMTLIKTIDLLPQGVKEAIAVFLIKTEKTAVLVETGPGLCINQITRALDEEGLEPGDLSGVIVTHIHLDHAGAVGFFTSHNVPVFVHPKGAPHLVDPSKLMRSAGRVYGEEVSKLWGPLEASPMNLVNAVRGNENIQINDLCFTAIETLGHADHHHAWRLEGDAPATFAGDAAGMVIPGSRYITLPMPPPEFNLKLWQESLAILEKEMNGPLVLTHFGEITEPKKHLTAVNQELEKHVNWILQKIESSNNDMQAEYHEWMQQEAIKEGVEPNLARIHISASLAGMGATGVSLWASKK